MNVEQSTPKKEIVTVAETARLCGLSRSRFYGLVKDGIMPQPSRNPTTKRPFYSREQQEQCMLVRRTNCGLNGKMILFYANKWSRDSVAPARRIRSTPVTKRIPTSSGTRQSDPVMDELLDGLGQLGLTDMTEAKIRTTLADEYPDGHANVAMPILLMTVFRRMNRQDSQDNVAR